MSIARRGRLFHLRRRVPRRYRGIEPRETVWISLHTDSETVARSRADRALSQIIEAREARLAGTSEDTEARQEAARDLVRAPPPTRSAARQILCEWGFCRAAGRAFGC